MSVPPGRSPGSTGETNLRPYTLSLLPSPPLGVQGIFLSLMGGVCARLLLEMVLAGYTSGPDTFRRPFFNTSFACLSCVYIELVDVLCHPLPSRHYIMLVVFLT